MHTDKNNNTLPAKYLITFLILNEVSPQIIIIKNYLMIRVVQVRTVDLFNKKSQNSRYYFNELKRVNLLLKTYKDLKVLLRISKQTYVQIEIN